MDQHTDGQLLLLAAKAAGYEVELFENEFQLYRPILVLGDDRWNPLEDDGDALRLAVRLRMSIVVCAIGNITHVREQYRIEWFSVEHRDDADAATRRAIVRAAAAIGEAMP